MRSVVQLLLGAMVVGLSACAGEPSAAADAGEPPDAGVDGGGQSLDAGEQPDAGPVTATVFPRAGAAADSVFTPQGPGLVLVGGGTDVDPAFGWMRQTLSPDSSARLGDVVVLRATGTNAYDAYLLGLAPFSSVQTVLLPPPSTAADLQLAASIVDRAEAVFFAGGDQSHYVAWAGSPLMAAVQRVYDRGGVVGGTSAGLAVLGQFVYDARTGSVTSAEALANPWDLKLSFSHDVLSLPPLAAVITDTHFGARDRFGRLVTFLARLVADHLVPASAPALLGVGVDQATALVVDRTGRASLLRQVPGSGAAYVVLGSAATQVTAGLPLVYPGLTVTRLDAAGQFYDFERRCGTGPTYQLSVNGSAADPFGGVNPYTAPGAPGSCP